MWTEDQLANEGLLSSLRAPRARIGVCGAHFVVTVLGVDDAVGEELERAVRAVVRLAVLNAVAAALGREADPWLPN